MAVFRCPVGRQTGVLETRSGLVMDLMLAGGGSGIDAGSLAAGLWGRWEVRAAARLTSNDEDLSG